MNLAIAGKNGTAWQTNIT